uniref:SFRICE_027514 n=1 Tax=Spodoptera frugiperda TaxID=7108 RepID=A0A2H1WPC0_SPOFR
MRNNLDEELKEINIKKNIRSRTVLTKSDMDLLWPTGKAISEAKLTDIRSILHLIPHDAKTFYKTLKGETIEDDIDGFTGPLDFEVEGDNSD